MGLELHPVTAKRIMSLEELDADGFAEGDVLMGVGEEACVAVSLEYLDLVAVAAAA